MTAILSYSGDNDTAILNKIWDGLDCRVVVVGKDYVTRKDIDEIISEESDTLILAGHGSSFGLFGTGDFDEFCIVDQKSVPLIKAKRLICVWCHAAQFGESQGLKGFFSGMFISNQDEASLYNIVAKDDVIWQLEKNFCNNLNELIRNDVSMNQWIGILKEHSDHNDPVDIFNMEGLRYFE